MGKRRKGKKEIKSEGKKKCSLEKKIRKIRKGSGVSK